MNVLLDRSKCRSQCGAKAKDLNSQERLLVAEWSELVREGRAKIIGVAQQELLSGIKTEEQFEALRKPLSAFPDEVVDTQDHEAAARAGNGCRKTAIAVSLVDMLICALAQRRGMSILTTDPGFRALCSRASPKAPFRPQRTRQFHDAVLRPQISFCIWSLKA